MKQLRLTPRASFVYYESSKNPEGIGSVSNKYKASQKLPFCACISSTIRAVIHITFDCHVNYNCFNEPFAVSPCEDLYWDMHGLIFETSIWLLAGSTRFYQNRQRPELPENSTFADLGGAEILPEFRFYRECKTGDKLSKRRSILKAKNWIRSSDAGCNPHCIDLDPPRIYALQNHSPTLRHNH